ncbi:MAG: amidohydrolase [Chloroflexi bacterium]|nr:amidohydrolase [Chloroflexota bacterium]
MAREYKRISADSHIEYPPDLWSKRVDAKYRDLAPKRVQLPDGGDGFIAEGGIYRGGSNLYASRDPSISKDDYSPLGLVWEDMAGTGDGAQRVRELDQDGIDAEVGFPGNGGVRNICRGIRNDDAYNALTQAYNEWLVEDFCSVAPDRLIGVGCIPDRGLDAAMAALEYCGKAGLKAVDLNGFPSAKSYPTLEDDRFWAAIVDMDMPLNVHTSFGATSARGPMFKYPIEPPADARPPDYVERLARYGIRSARNAVQLVMGGVFDRFPTLKVHWAESQIGWLPIYLEQMDHNYKRHHRWAEKIYGIKPLKRLPSETIKEHMYWGFFDDPIGIKMRYEIGVDRIMWGGDFPHIESDWPDSDVLLKRTFADVPDDEAHMMVAGNAVEFFHLQELSPDR